jgi:transaldolase
MTRGRSPGSSGRNPGAPRSGKAPTAAGDRYNDQLAELAALGADVDTAFTVATQDVRAACDVLAPVYARTDGLDGCVSIEVDPWLSRDAAANR